MYSRTYLLSRTALVTPELTTLVENLGGELATTTTAETYAGSDELTFAAVANISAGFTVTAGAGLAASTTVVSTNSGTETVKINNNVTANIASSTAITFTTTATVNGAVGSGATIVLHSVAGLVAGGIMAVTGTGIAASSSISTINSGASSITLNNAVSGTVTDGETLTFTFSQNTTAETYAGANILNVSNPVDIIPGMVPANGANIAATTTVVSINTDAVTLSANVLSNISNGATVSFKFNEFTGMQVTPFISTLNDTQTMLHMVVEASAGGSEQNVIANQGNLTTFGNNLANAVAAAGDYTTTLSSVAALGSQINIDIIVDV